MRPNDTTRGRSRGTSGLHLVRPETESCWSDADIVAGLGRGDPRAQRLCWERHAPTVFRVAQRALGSREDARDLMQDALLCVLSKAGSIDKPEALRAFVMSVTIRTLKHELRRRRLRRWLVLSHSGEVPDAPASEPDHASRQLLRRFYGALDALDPETRLTFVLRRVEGLTLEEVAQAMDLSLATVKRRLSAASDKLSRLMQRDPELWRTLGAEGAQHG